nr:hypothetical protein CFP56_25760 [Quercus suber]
MGPEHIKILETCIRNGLFAHCVCALKSTVTPPRFFFSSMALSRWAVICQPFRVQVVQRFSMISKYHLDRHNSVMSSSTSERPVASNNIDDPAKTGSQGNSSFTIMFAAAPLQLSVDLGHNEPADQSNEQDHGWDISHARVVASTSDE